MLILTLTLILACAGIWLHVGRLPAQNLFALTLLIVVLAAAAEWGAMHWNIPYRPWQIEGANFWVYPTAWVAILLVARKISQRLFLSRRGNGNYGLFVFESTILLTVCVWAVIGATLHRLTILDLVGRLFTAVVILLAIFPWLIVKRPVSSPPR